MKKLFSISLLFISLFASAQTIKQKQVEGLSDSLSRKKYASTVLGYWLNTTFPGTSLPSNVTTYAATYAVNDGLTLSGGNGDYFNNIVFTTDNSTSNNWTQTIEFTLNTKPSIEADGLVMGRISNASTAIHLAVTFKMSDATHARLTLRTFQTYTTPAAIDSTVGVVSMINGAKYRVNISVAHNQIFSKVTRYDNTGDIETTQMFHDVEPKVGYTLPNLGNTWLTGLGGSYTITKWQEYHHDIVNADAVFMGTSITQWFYATTPNNHYTYKVFENTGKTYAVLAGGGDVTADLLLDTAELWQLSPKYVFVESGVNDGCANIRANLTVLLSRIKAHNIIPILVEFVSQSCKDTIYYNVSREQGVKYINVAASMVSTDYVDGIHPTDQGFAKGAKIIRAEAPEVTGWTGATDSYSFEGLKDVDVSGVSDGNQIIYDASRKKWTSSGSTSSFIKNNGTITPQASANFNIDGSGTLGGYLGVGTQAAIGNLIHALTNSADGIAGLNIENTNSTGSQKNISLFQLGTNGYGVTDWANAGLVEAGAAGGLVLSGFGGSIKFQTGSSRTTRMGINSSGVVNISGLAGNGTGVVGVDNSGNLSWSAGGGGMTNPMTTTGDIIYGGASGVPTRLAAGTNGYMLSMISGVPSWVNGANWGGLFTGGSISSGTTATISAGTQYYISTATSTATYTLPALATSRAWFLKNAGSADMVINRAGTDVIWTDASVTTFTLTPGQSAMIVGGASSWYVFFQSSSGGTPTTQMSITSDGSGLKLVNDETTPTNGKFYGISGGSKGWYTPSGTSWNGQFLGVSGINANYTLESAYSAYYITTSGITITVPAMVAAGMANKVFYLKNKSAGSVTIQRSSTDQFYTTSAVNSFSLGAAEYVMIWNDGVNWTVHQMPTSSSGVADGDKGDITVSGTGAIWTIDNSAVTLAKIANIADQTILGNNTGGSAAPVALTAAQTKTVLSLNNVDNTSDATKNSASVTLTNKTIASATNNVEGTLVNVRFLTSGTTYTPTTGTTKALIVMIGAGGGGGGVTGAASSVGAAGGGGAGGYCVKFITGVTGTYTYAIGAAGTAGANTGGNGGNGGNTTFTNGGTTYTAFGGSGGVGQTTGTAAAFVLGGAGAVVSTNGDINAGGSPGLLAYRVSGTLGYSGTGGDTEYGGAGIGLTAAAAGNAATGYGAGGGGGLSTANTARAGGAGAPGLIMIYEYK